MTTFEKLNAINLNGHIEKKNNLTYLSWAWAWAEVKKACPDATYKIGETDYDEVLGFMCHSSVTIEGETLDMWLPVMDGANQSMKKYAYEYATRYGNKSVAAATTFDINKTMMRCLVKNLAMFGLGLYIYAGEDLPEVAETPQLVDPIELKELKKGDENWIKVVKYVTENKGADSSVIIQQLSRKYKVSTALKKEITSLLS